MYEMGQHKITIKFGSSKERLSRQQAHYLKEKFCRK